LINSMYNTHYCTNLILRARIIDQTTSTDTMPVLGRAATRNRRRLEKNEVKMHDSLKREMSLATISFFRSPKSVFLGRCIDHDNKL